jgi:O-methyltransferase involved in polyketide biosynthesis
MPEFGSPYILLGAGFDTFAVRQPVWALRLRILEVDHEGTQTSKSTQLAAARRLPLAI